jgi:hypothetical protein
MQAVEKSVATSIFATGEGVQFVLGSNRSCFICGHPAKFGSQS